MKFSAATVAFLASVVAASPIVQREEAQTTQAHQLNVDDSSSLAAYTSINELDNGACRKYILFFARGTTQAGNVVSLKHHDLHPQNSSSAVPAWH